MALSSAAGPALSRRTFLAASTAGLALLVTGCTSSEEPGREPVTAAQVDLLADQVRVQENVVASYAAAAAVNAAFGQETSALAAQAEEQLERLRAASPGGTASSSAAAPTAGSDVRAWLRQQVTAAADSHAAACLEQFGARAALLGSLAAGLRGHAARLG